MNTGSEKDNGSDQEKDDHPHTTVHTLEDHTTEATVQLPPPDFPVTIIDSNRSDASSLKLDVKVDDSDSKTVVTDDEGRFYIYTPKEKIVLSLNTKEDESKDEQKPKPRKATNDDDVLTPIEVKK